MGAADPVGNEAARVLGIASVPHILDIVCRTTGMGFAAIARVTPERWITCASLDHLQFGLKPGDELKVETTICHEVRGCDERIVIDDVAADAHWREHHTPRMYGFRSYISVPIRLGDGSFFGTLCAIDPQPRTLNEPRTLALFESFAELLGREIDSVTALEQSRAALRDERETARLREEFIAVLGHDLRTPLASLMAGVRMLRSGRAGNRVGEITELMQTTLQRMEALVGDLLDLARASLGEGIPVTIEPCGTLDADIAQVVDEVRTASGREIVASIDLGGTVACDRQRLCQLVSNLLDNAVAHGASESPVRIEAVRIEAVRIDAGRIDAGRADNAFRLTVANSGSPVPPEVRESIFQPFVRAGRGAGEGGGLGLGLYIAAQIARAHGGALSIDSDAGETRFTFQMPLH